jgi:hypothetical protein
MTRQARILAWAVASFGAVARNRDERAARLAEEAIEVAQAEGVSLEVIQRIAARVYSRPAGEIGREIGGVALTLEALAENLGRSADADCETELARVLAKPADHWRTKHAEKVAAGTADLSPTERDEVDIGVGVMRRPSPEDEAAASALMLPHCPRSAYCERDPGHHGDCDELPF